MREIKNTFGAVSFYRFMIPWCASEAESSKYSTINQHIDVHLGRNNNKMAP